MNEKVMVEQEERRGVIKIEPCRCGGVYMEWHSGTIVRVGTGTDITLQSRNVITFYLHSEMINGGVLVGKEVGRRAGLAG